MCEIIQERLRNPFKRISFGFALSRDYWRQKKALRVLHDFTDKMIQERRQLLQNNNETFLSYTNDESLNVYGKSHKSNPLETLEINN